MNDDKTNGVATIKKEIQKVKVSNEELLQEIFKH